MTKSKRKFRHIWRKGYMRKLVFEPYKSGDVEARPYKIHSLLWQAVYNAQWRAPDDDRASARAMAKLLDAIDSVTFKNKTNGIERNELKAEGGILLLEDAEFELLKAGWKALVPLTPQALSRERVAVHEFLDNAETVKVEEKKEENA